MRDIGHVDEDIVGGVAVERSTETFLIEVVANETNRSAKDEETIEGTDLFNSDKYRAHLTEMFRKMTYLNVLISLIRSECTTVSEKVDEADGNATVNIEDELEGGVRRGS